MICVQTNKYRFTNAMGIILLLLGTGTCLCQAQEPNEPNSTVGELKLEGKDVERLVLRRNDGHTERFDKPKEVVRLPVGQYHVMESHLSSGHSCFQGAGPNVQRIIVGEKEAGLLKVGAPLQQVLDVKRRGRDLVLDYKLLGVGGEAYASKDRSKPPSFTIYKGDREIASDKFKFG